MQSNMAISPCDYPAHAYWQWRLPGQGSAHEKKHARRRARKPAFMHGPPCSGCAWIQGRLQTGLAAMMDAGRRPFAGINRVQTNKKPKLSSIAQEKNDAYNIMVKAGEVFVCL
ncbi:MAG TPA: hypothetical protein IAA66_01370 [Candidatus Avichristensenella intestinipullorum]|uniref:Uncharacterized protein n=1 Tax=Candidatus Avichristensenella intestinipullorum TaxID=2840693 RepID=A0A9D0YUA9_9FIRM|nr:hypothetical protein [Candidatus Avichristensenella intestinipullorum]